MIKINNEELKKVYIEKYNINKIFTADLNEYIELVLFEKNEYICREEEDIKHIFFYVKGKAKVYTTLSNGKALLLCIYNPFKMLGDLEFVNCQKATTNVKIIEDSYCLVLSLDKVRNILLDDKEFLRYALSSVGDKLNRISKNSAINLLYPLENRLASYILATMESEIINEEEKFIFNENLSEVSELIGTSYRHLLRGLKELCNKRILVKSNSSYVINDCIGLKELAQDLYIE